MIAPAGPSAEFVQMVVSTLGAEVRDLERRRREADALLGDLGMVECPIRTEPCLDCDEREGRDFDV